MWICQVQNMGKTASKFIQEQLQMKYVYDYMFHLLSQYSKLLRYKPTIPKNAVEYCSERMACGSEGLLQNFMVESMVTGPSETSPCRLPPPYDPSSFSSILWRNEKVLTRVDSMEKKYYWKSENQTRQS